MMEAVKMVLSGAIGIRRRSAHDAARVRPLQLAIVAVVFVALFILGIRTVVHFVTS
jgi:Protein of unknown function (DUF2970)